jgi:hypothetical protein
MPRRRWDGECVVRGAASRPRRVILYKGFLMFRMTGSYLTRGFLACVAVASAPVSAANIDRLGSLAQSEFALFSKDLTAALSYKAVTPAEPLGVTGFDLGAEVSATRMKQSALWQVATGSDTSVLPLAKLHIHKGLPFGLDVGAVYTMVPNSNIRYWGADLKYALVEGSTVLPAVAVRGAYTRVDGVTQLDFNTRSVDVSVSKGLAMFTPYAGVGRVWSEATPHVAGLTAVSQSENKIFAGLNFNVLLGNLAVEWDRTGDNDTLSAKLGARF